MKIYKILGIVTLGFSFLLGTASCTKGYESANQDPGGATEEEMDRDGYRLSSSFRTIGNFIIPVEVNTNQFTDCLLGGSYGGYLADSNDGFNGKNFATYNPEDHWSRVMFNDIIPKVYAARKSVSDLTDDPVPLAAADIMAVMAISRVTDTYGPIPFSQIGVDGAMQAPYDSQQEVYNEMFRMLDNSIEVLTERPTEDFSPKVDDVYGGIVMKWIKLANSMKLRLAIRISKADPTLAQQKAEEAVNHIYGVIADPSESAYKSSPGKNPFRVVTYEYNEGDSRISADIASYMNGYNDPRREKYFTPSQFTSPTITNGYHGLRSGINMPGGGAIKLYSNMNVSVDSKLLWMNAAECAFLKAEGALYGWNMGGTPEQFYKQGVELSFNELGVGGADQYLKDGKSKPMGYKDPMGLHSYTGSPSDITIKWDDSDSQEKQLERIITQKWIANFPLGLEAWADYRRTGYPKLMEVVVNNSSGTVDSKRMARRLPYPQLEYEDNRENVLNAVNQHLKGPDNLGTDVWWAKN